MTREIPKQMITSGKSERQRSEKGILLEPDEYQSSRHPGDLGNLPRDYNNKDTKISQGKAITVALNALQQLSWPH